VLDAAVMPETFERPASFNLAAFWRDWCAQVEENRPHYPVTVRVAPDLTPWLPYFFGDPIRDQIAGAGPPDTEGWITLTLSFETMEDARERILGFGRAMEVLSPQALRNTVFDYATQIVSLYTR
jgi:predicted DNA-binding transcriptional regulator YafY